MRVLTLNETGVVAGGRMIEPELYPPAGGPGSGGDDWSMGYDQWMYEGDGYSDVGGSGGISLPIDTIPGFGQIGVYGTWGSSGPQVGLYDQSGSNLVTLTTNGNGQYFGSYSYSGNPQINVQVSFGNKGASASINAKYKW